MGGGREWVESEAGVVSTVEGVCMRGDGVNAV